MVATLNMNKNNRVFWLGRELEGQYSGLWTLFIVGDQYITEIQAALRKCQTYNKVVGHLYFGAGNQSTVTNYDTLRYFISLGYFVTYEIMIDQINSVPLDIQKDCHLMICIKNDVLNLMKPSDTIKFETSDLIYCSSKNQFISNDFSGYQDDIGIIGVPS